ncbi:FKBP-type peptidyl-prolyl cis-trans isomerase [Salinibius halmophilus]|uniref:FKBP-type peptidyl-prolyl cis-trans isomerase n=1 Tax=Salinibius halmophilus TaxID=1853216 RepID=UPI000E6719E7|nr:FKBP-type peptidyl-prolyl cis-trans isomerase [Salinibius halmophilus]
MKLKFLPAAVLSSAALLSTSAFALEPTELNTESFNNDQILSYGFGYQLGLQVESQFDGEFDLDVFTAAVIDAMTQADPQVEAQAFSAAYQAMMEEREAQEQAAAAERLAANDAYLEENAQRDGVVTTESGLQYEVVSQSGSGESPAATDTVRVHYTGTLTDGTVFDSSVERGTPATFPVNGVIPGWVEGLQLMEVGDKFNFTIPSELAYGEQSPSPAIPANSVLLFEVELLEIVDGE